MKLNRQVVARLLAAFLLFQSSSAEIVTTEDGQVEGTVLNSRLGVNFFVFLRIPFAEPPIGALRFQDPIPISPWTGVHDGTFYGPMCVQANARPNYGISEDCLHLNIHTKNLTESRPVIFFIHGGGYVIGTARDQGDPTYLMDRDVVVVSINYRLGALGFLASGNKEAPGNAGLKDQAVALNWVHKNIARFGGDPNRIIVSGLSAGAASATAHMVSPMSKGLFSGIFAMSGAITGLNPMRRDNADLVARLGEKLSCSTDKVEDTIACLITKPPLEIMTADISEHQVCGRAAFVPVFEPDVGQTRFFIDDPITLMKNGDFERVPLIIGRTVDEGLSSVPRFLNSTRLKEINDDFEDIAPRCFAYERDTDKSKAISRILRNSYLPLETIDQRSFEGLSQLFGDSVIGYSTHRFAHLAARYSDVYYYKFSYVGRYSYFYYPRTTPFGVAHADDLQYIFQPDFIGPVFQSNDPEIVLVDRMTKVMESFGVNGDPNYDAQEIVWPKLNNLTEFYLDIGIHMVEKHGLYLERYRPGDGFEFETGSASGIRVGKIILILCIAIKSMFL